jgi:hypothetical protein
MIVNLLPISYIPDIPRVKVISPFKPWWLSRIYPFFYSYSAILGDTLYWNKVAEGS